MALIIARIIPLSFRGNLRVQRLRHFYTSSIFLSDDFPKKDPANRLSALLQNIIKEEMIDDKEVAPSKHNNVFKKHKLKLSKPKDLGKQIVESAEEVSKILPGKQEQTEAELLHRLLYKDKSLTESIIKAASVKNSLMGILSDISIEEAPQKRLKPTKNIKDFEYTKAHKVKDVLQMKKTHFRPRSAVVPVERINLFGQEPLGIFGDLQTAAEEVPMKTWNSLQRRDLQIQTTHPPTNIYEQMIIWTERGMLWKFPIDNEQGLDEEKETDFTEHIFLENYLDDWCPEQGPIRHFMELVCVGLSKNYWLSAKEKKDHLLWYKEFFTSKKELLLEIGAGEIKQSASPEAIAS